MTDEVTINTITFGNTTLEVGQRVIRDGDGWRGTISSFNVKRYPIKVGQDGFSRVSSRPFIEVRVRLLSGDETAGDPRNWKPDNPKRLPPYDHTACPKCGSGADLSAVAYCTNVWCSKIRDMVKEPHLHHSCVVCGFMHTTLPKDVGNGD